MEPRRGDAPPWEGKWKAYDETRGARPTPGQPRHILPQGKAWLLRWVWWTSTGMLILGAILIVLILAGAGGPLGR